MDWLRLFALLIAVASLQVTADGPKKKIRIHLPQKVKHIHHHKKIYITNHPASSQYAPAYLPSADGAVAVPSIVPLNSVELFDEPQTGIKLPGVTPSASKLLPLYKARGYYGTTPSDWDDQEYDISSPSEPEDDEDYTGPSASPPERKHPPKRVKVIKINETPRKKPNRKQKPKRGPPRNPRPQQEEEHPVSSFHEQFYSDVDGLGTLRKIKKPQRVEKIVDGDTEHIHTYSEEHIHKVIFDDGAKLVGVDPGSGVAGIKGPRPLIPFNNGQTLLAIPSESLSGFSALGSLAAPSHLEYSSYNPRDVTHDHIFHDHGEIPADVDISKETLGFPPKISYNSQGLRISNNKRYKQKSKPTKAPPGNDFSYYESIYTPFSALKKLQRPKLSQYDPQPESNIDNYRQSLKLLGKSKGRALSHSASEYRLQQSNAPLSVSTTVVHDYQPKTYPGALPPSGFSKFKDPYSNFRDGYTNNFEYDSFASSSNVHTSEDKNDNNILSLHGSKGKKKSVSTQNIRFGRQEHESMIDHMGESIVGVEDDDNTPTALDDHFSSFGDSKPPESVTSTPYTIKETSPMHHYYTAMAVKALQSEPGSMPEASNDNFQYVEPPPPSTTSHIPNIATTTSAPIFFELQNSEAMSTEPSIPENDQRRRPHVRNTGSERDTRQRYPILQDYKAADRPVPNKVQHQVKYTHDGVVDSVIKGLKYGDKI